MEKGMKAGPGGTLYFFEAFVKLCVSKKIKDLHIFRHAPVNKTYDGEIAVVQFPVEHLVRDAAFCLL